MRLAGSSHVICFQYTSYCERTSGPLLKIVSDCGIELYYENDSELINKGLDVQIDEEP